MIGAGVTVQEEQLFNWPFPYARQTHSYHNHISQTSGGICCMTWDFLINSPTKKDWYKYFLSRTEWHYLAIKAHLFWAWQIFPFSLSAVGHGFKIHVKKSTALSCTNRRNVRHVMETDGQYFSSEATSMRPHHCLAVTWYSMLAHMKLWFWVRCAKLLGTYAGLIGTDDIQKQNNGWGSMSETSL